MKHNNKVRSRLVFGARPRFLRRPVLFFLYISALPILSCSAHGPLFSPAQVKDDSAILYIFRSAQSLGAAGTFKFYIDGAKVIDLKNNSYTYVYLPAGEHEIKMHTGDNIDLSAKETFEAGKPYYLKSEIDVLGGRFKISFREEEFALSEIQPTHFQEVNPDYKKAVQ